MGILETIILILIIIAISIWLYDQIAACGIGPQCHPITLPKLGINASTTISATTTGVPFP